VGDRASRDPQEVGQVRLLGEAVEADLLQEEVVVADPRLQCRRQQAAETIQQVAETIGQGR